MNRIKTFLLVLFVAFPLGAAAQPAAGGAVRIVAPFPPGGITDLLARALSEELAKALGQPVIVENRAGAGGNVGADVVAKSAPTGQVLLMSSASPLAINEFLYRTMPFNPAEAFAPVSRLADMPQILVVHPKRAATLAEFLSAARERPGALSIGSAGNGSVAHLALELFMQTAKVKLLHVPYKGAGPAMQDALAGQVDGNFTNPPTVVGHVQSGRLRALGVAGKKRLIALPDVPTFEESGVGGFEASAWFGLLAPAGTPDAVIARFNAALVKILGGAEFRQRFAAMGADVAASTPREFDLHIRAERQKWGAIISGANIRLD